MSLKKYRNILHQCVLCVSAHQVCTSSISGVTHSSLGNSSTLAAGRSPHEGQTKTPPAALYRHSAFQCSHLPARSECLKPFGSERVDKQETQLCVSPLVTTFAWQHSNSELNTCHYTLNLCLHTMFCHCGFTVKTSWRLRRSSVINYLQVVKTRPAYWIFFLNVLQFLTRQQEIVIMHE